MRLPLRPEYHSLKTPVLVGSAYPASVQNKGSILIVILIFLLISAVVGSSTFFSSFSESQKSFNYVNSTLAFQNAESGLRAGEDFLLNLEERPDIVDPGTDVTAAFPVYDSSSLAGVVVEPDRLWPEETLTWWNSFGNDTPATVPDLPDPVVIIEEVHFLPDSAAKTNNYGTNRPGVVFYQVSVRSSGRAASAATLQSILAARYN